jgi:formylglycine-generating enzyme required for sulfatase activity
MKKLLFVFVVVTTVLSSCGDGGRGELIGVQGRRPWFQPDPYGMLYIPAGSYNMGQSDEDVPFSHTTRSKTVSIAAFYMDQTEISNNEYRQFVYYVRDSIARRILGEDFAEEFLVVTYDDDL